eukprot:TRINITY_DN7352_c0_g2_i1.p1 TRINITY_DN7352_c0_g2~~TRINITY_DN7352_c0_g2_i1.p1  ORF type:complete len:100 (+),score=19.36 TRINITY_DN7352_c0_g2_i1:55-354(+)
MRKNLETSNPFLTCPAGFVSTQKYRGVSVALKSQPFPLQPSGSDTTHQFPPESPIPEFQHRSSAISRRNTQHTIYNPFDSTQIQFPSTLANFSLCCTSS